MFSYLRKPSSSVVSSGTSFSSDNSYIQNINTSQPTILRQLAVNELADVSSTGFNQHYSMQRDSFDISRPLFTIPRPAIYLPTNNSVWTPYTRSIRAEQSSRSSSPSLITHHSERPLYQNVPFLPTLPASIPSVLTQYQIEPSPFRSYVPVPMVRPLKQKKRIREKPPGFFTTLCAGGLSTVAALMYLILLLGLPTVKLVLGILYVKECPINSNIPLYMIIAGASGLIIVILLLLSSACTLCRFTTDVKKPTHGLIICIIGIARGMQGVIAIFLFVWFFFGNIWIFNARYRIRTDKPNDLNNYCHPTLYWFAYYTLLFTYIYAFFTCCMKFCCNFFCCGAFNAWHKAFS